MRNLTVTSHVTISYYRDIFFSRESVNGNMVLSLQLDLKISFSLQYAKSLSIVHLSLLLKSSQMLPKYDKTKLNFL